MANVVATIEIEKLDDGTFTISKESAKEEMTEGGEATEAPDTAKVTARNLSDALNIARSMALSVKAPKAAAPGLGASLMSKPGVITAR